MPVGIMSFYKSASAPENKFLKKRLFIENFKGQVNLDDVPVAGNVSHVLEHEALQVVVLIHQLSGEDLSAILKESKIVSFLFIKWADIVAQQSLGMVIISKIFIKC